MPGISRFNKHEIAEHFSKAIKLEAEYATKLRDALQKIASLPSLVDECDVGKEAVSIANQALKGEIDDPDL